jgi:hypothetical protein
VHRDDRGLYLAFDVAEEREVLIKQLLRGGGEVRRVPVTPLGQVKITDFGLAGLNEHDRRPR